jgi:hypothetical protein
MAPFSIVKKLDKAAKTDAIQQIANANFPNQLATQFRSRHFLEEISPNRLKQPILPSLATRCSRLNLPRRC